MHRRVWWAAALAAVMLVPVVITEVRTGSHLWATLSSGLGVLALSALIATVVAPSRIRSLTAAFGVERILGLHRWLGILAVVLVVMHLLVAVTGHPQLINPGTLTGAAKAGWSSTAALLLTGWVAVRARRPGARYEFWARAHVGLAAAGLVLAALHVLWLGHLVADPVMRVVLSALLMVLLAVLAHRWVWRPLFSRQGAYVVYGVRRESPTVCTLVLAPVHVRRGGLRFSAGQFVWLRLRRGVVGTEEHPFTIASSANVTGRLELTVRDSGDFSAVLACLHTGCKVWLDGPHGSFTADVGTAAESDGLVLLAGGVGITPMMSMLRTLAERSDRRTHRLVVAERGAEPLFADELTALSRRLDLRVTRTEGRRIDAALLAEVVPDPAERQRLEYFVCGSPSITTGSLAALEQLGVPPVRIHTEQFGWTGAVPVPAPRDGTGPAADQAGKTQAGTTQAGPTHAGPAPRSRTGGRRRAG